VRRPIEPPVRQAAYGNFIVAGLVAFVMALMLITDVGWKAFVGPSLVLVLLLVCGVLLMLRKLAGAGIMLGLCVLAALAGVVVTIAEGKGLAPGLAMAGIAFGVGTMHWRAFRALQRGAARGFGAPGAGAPAQAERQRQQLALERGGPQRLDVSWVAGFKDLVVLLDGIEIGSASSLATLKGDGLRLGLPDGSVLSLQVRRRFLTGAWRLRYLRDGAPLPGSEPEPIEKLKTAARLVACVGLVDAGLCVMATLGAAPVSNAAGPAWKAALAVTAALLGAAIWGVRSYVVLVAAALFVVGDMVDTVLAGVLAQNSYGTASLLKAMGPLYLGAMAFALRGATSLRHLRLSRRALRELVGVGVVVVLAAGLGLSYWGLSRYRRAKRRSSDEDGSSAAERADWERRRKATGRWETVTSFGGADREVRLLALVGPDVLVGAGAGSLWRSASGGRSWKRHYEHPRAAFKHLLALGPRRLLAVDRWRTSYLTTDGGRTWKPWQPEAVERPVASWVWRDTVWLVDKDKVARSTDGGQHFEAVAPPVQVERWQGVAGLSSGEVVLLGRSAAGSTLVVGDASGETWRPADPPPPADLLVIGGDGQGALFAGGERGVLLANLGPDRRRWQRRAAPCSDRITLVTARDGELCVLCGEDPYCSYDFGRSWEDRAATRRICSLIQRAPARLLGITCSPPMLVRYGPP